MRRREFISGFVAAAAWPVAVRAQVAARRPVIAFLAVPTFAAYDRYRGGFLQGLHELGYFEDRNVQLVERYADGFLERLPALAEELVRLKPDVIVAGVSSAAVALRRFTTTIPIVVATMADPIRLGLIASDARPGGNVTGLLVNLDGLPGKQLQVAAELVPGASKIGFLFNISNPGIAFMRSEVETAAAMLGLRVVIAEARSPDDLDMAFHLFATRGVSSVLVAQDSTFNSERSRIAALAGAARLPWVAGQREFAEAGAVISYGINVRESFRRAGTYVDKILKGVPPGELPVELPSNVETVVNLKSAKALGLTVPPALLGRADEVIE
jgi:putative ABC transport system substrate-binding protein